MIQIIKAVFSLFFVVCPFFAMAQSTYFNQGSKDIHFVDRLEIKEQTNADLNFSATRPFSRRYIVSQVESIDSAKPGYTHSLGQYRYKTWNSRHFTNVDQYNLHSLLMSNAEWVTMPDEYFVSKKPILKSFYKTKTNLLEINNKKNFLAVNPVIQLQIGKENDNSELMFKNTVGLVVRGMITNKAGFSGFVTDNRERGPVFFQQRVDSLNAVPGVGYYEAFKKTGYHYFDARGYISFNATKFIDVQFGYDKNFIGSGYRSLFLSDWGSSYLFLKLNTRIWKFNYQNLYMQLTPQFKKTGEKVPYKKYAVMHHLSINVTKWLNLGGFEGVIFNRTNGFDFEYLNPVIFYRSVEGNIGSPDNALIGFDFKANIMHRAQLYGQFLLDEFVLSRLKNDPGYWANKYGFQLGAKYVDAFGISNLDLQVETNRMRPFTYSHGDKAANYTHYNQPLAHPLGANFQEFIGIVNYQPKPKWLIYARSIYYYQGLDSAGKSFGANPFENYYSRIRESGFKIGSGTKATCLNSLVQVSYEWKQNLYFDVSLQYRTYKIANVDAKSNTIFFNAGFRLNVFRRDYDY